MEEKIIIPELTFEENYNIHFLTVSFQIKWLTYFRDKDTTDQQLLLSHFSHVRLCATPQTAAHQAPPSLGFSRQEHWSGLPFPSPMCESEK